MSDPTEAMDGPTLHVQVAREDLAAAIGSWRGWKRSQFSAEVQVYLDGDALVIDSGGSAVEVPCSGIWECVARVPVDYFLGLIGKLPPNPSIDVRVSGERFYIGSSSIGCVVQPLHVSEPDLIFNPTLADILALAYSRTPEQLDQAGLRPKVVEAEEKAAKLVDNAMVHLAKLGVSREQLMAFIRNELAGPPRPK